MTAKLPKLLVIAFSWADYDDDDIQSAINRNIQRGYKILKINEFPIRTIVRKVLHVYDDSPIHTDVSLGEGDTLSHVMWTRVWMER